ncbi:MULTISPECIES: ABC transporter ATP-binding protein [Nocardiopsis]|uniref:ABC transporter ATP-binding protein n=1 Tax=Nocardiopsis sinuspersici TaxID=501010 RepID=A0A1V3C2J4_9ACTN|nr:MULTISPECIES: ABC transporter ATP-binding protein [Nocardiopsis]NYH50911.1 branched-chain amino acid transport system ATP-binding protein [Nocardiopsis sinuspersici]OOC54726.1 ABC transporter ATP-binding protein [Nocardiopsis sinuspersici]
MTENVNPRPGPGEVPAEAEEVAEVQEHREEVLEHAGAEEAEVGGPQDYLLLAKDLVAGYVPGVNVLNGCTLTLTEGEVVAIIGPNGAGKSTLIKAVFGLIPIREGGLTLRGSSIAGLPAHSLVERGVGYVPQTRNVFPSLTIEENLQMGAFLRPRAFAERFRVVAGLFPLLADRRKAKAGSLSGGERQMVAMGRALMMDPSVLLLDEPTAGLSPIYQEEVFQRVKEVNQTGVSVVMVEQNARRCLQICDRGYVLDQGRNAYTGSGADLLEDPNVIELYLGTLAKG